MKLSRSSKNTAKLHRIRTYVESLCGIYSRVARKLGVDRTYVSRVAKGERNSPAVEAALIQDFDHTEEEFG
jgi:DNA-binding transcriptional regulator YdaS (Cro superfamily)